MASTVYFHAAEVLNKGQRTKSNKKHYVMNTRDMTLADKLLQTHHNDAQQRDDASYACC